jgi:hypothetical protein
VKPGGGLLLRELMSPDTTLDEVRAKTTAAFTVDLQPHR